jgi:hypothetical protein
MNSELRELFTDMKAKCLKACNKNEKGSALMDAMLKLELYLESDFYALWKMEKEQRQREAMTKMEPKVVVEHSYFR